MKAATSRRSDDTGEPGVGAITKRPKVLPRYWTMSSTSRPGKPVRLAPQRSPPSVTTPKCSMRVGLAVRHLGLETAVLQPEQRCQFSGRAPDDELRRLACGDQLGEVVDEATLFASSEASSRWPRLRAAISVIARPTTSKLISVWRSVGR